MDNYYKPLLGSRLEFPEKWAGIVIEICPNGAGWQYSHDYEMVDFLYKRPYGLTDAHYSESNRWVFFHWHELLNVCSGVKQAGFNTAQK